MTNDQVEVLPVSEADISLSELRLALEQAHYALKDYNQKQPGCGFDKLAVACRLAGDRLSSQSPPVEVRLAETEAMQRLFDRYSEAGWLDSDDVVFFRKLAALASPQPPRDEMPTHEEIVQAMYDVWPTRVISEALVERTGKALNETLSLAELREAGGDALGLEKLADGVITLLQSRAALKADPGGGG